MPIGDRGIVAIPSCLKLCDESVHGSMRFLVVRRLGNNGSA
jgi:hypothetical protein